MAALSRSSACCLLALFIVTLAPRPAAGQPAPIIPADTSAAIASSIALGPAIASSLGGLAASSALTGFGLLAAHEQKMQTLKGLCTQIVDANLQIKTAVASNTADKALTAALTPFTAVQQKVATVQGLLAAGGAKAGQAIAGLVTLGSGVPALLKTAAGAAATLKFAPITAAKAVLTGGIKAATSLGALTGKLIPLLAGNKALQLGLAKFGLKLGGLPGIFRDSTTLTSGFTGINSDLVTYCTNVAKALGGLAGAEAEALLSAPKGVLSALEPLLG